MNFEIICGDAVRNLKHCDMIFADPPDNIGLDYEDVDDSMPDEEYVAWFGDCLFEFCRAAPCVWVSFNAKWLADFGEAFAVCRHNFDHEFKPFVQTFTFYRQNKTCVGNAHRPLWRLKKPDAPENIVDVKIPSWRSLNGDKRAPKDGLKVPGDSFDFFIEFDDSFFDYSRVVGNSAQRRTWHPTQLNEDLVERCVKLNTNEGDLVLDPFAGTGTTLRVCKRINRNCRLIEKSQMYSDRLMTEHSGIAMCGFCEYADTTDRYNGPA